MHSVTEPLCSFSVLVKEARQTNNWLTIGIASNTFPNTSSDGFGRNSSSWWAHT